MASSDFDFNISSKLVISLEAVYIVLLSGKLARLAFFMNKNESLVNKLNSIGRNIKPCGILEANNFNRHPMLFILTFVSFFLNRST